MDSHEQDREMVDLEQVANRERAAASRQKRNRKGKGRGSRAQNVKRTRRVWCDSHQTHHTQKWCDNHQRFEEIPNAR